MALGNPIIMEFCRLCQCHLGKVPIKYDNDLIKKIVEVTRVEVNDELNTYLPMNICVTCVQKIIDMYSFIQTIQRVDRNLRTAIKNKLLADIGDNTTTVENSDPEEEVETVIKCEKCLASFSDENLLKVHINSHVTEMTSFKCPVCSKSYNRVSSYNSHKKTHSELHCRSCKQTFDAAVDCKIHKCNGTMKKEKNGLKNLSKTKTLKKSKPKFKIKSDVLEFATIPQKGDTFQCNNCNKVFKNKNKLRVHLKIHKNFVCPQENCYKELPSAHALKVHQLNHLGKRPYLCVTCGKGFITKNSLTCHEKIHADVKGYRCDLCNIGFSVRSNLRAHERKYHEGVRFYCSQCTKEFLTKSSLDRHEKIHVGIKEFKCEHCTSAFYTSKELLKHQRYHLGLRLYKCDECFKTFFESHHLTIHLRTHSGERPYVCKIPGCGKSFAESQKLKRHQTAKHNSIT